MRLTRPGGHPAGEHPAPEILERYREGELGDAEARAVAEHVESCSVCRMEMEQTSDMLRMLSALPQFPAPRSFAVDDLSARRQTQAHNRSLWPAYASLAASIVLALGFFGSLTGGFGAGRGVEYASSVDGGEGGAPPADERTQNGGGASGGAASESGSSTGAVAGSVSPTDAPAQPAAGAAATIAMDVSIASAPERDLTAATARPEGAPAPVAGDTAAAAPTRGGRSVAKAMSPNRPRLRPRGSRTAVAAAGAGAGGVTRPPRTATAGAAVQQESSATEAPAQQEPSATEAPAADEEQGAAPADSPTLATAVVGSEALDAPTPASAAAPENAAPIPPTTDTHSTEAYDAPAEDSARESGPLTGVLGTLSLASLVLAVALFLRARMLG